MFGDENFKCLARKNCIYYICSELQLGLHIVSLSKNVYIRIRASSYHIVESFQAVQVLQKSGPLYS